MTLQLPTFYVLNYSRRSCISAGTYPLMYMIIISCKFTYINVRGLIFVHYLVTKIQTYVYVLHLKYELVIVLLGSRFIVGHTTGPSHARRVLGHRLPARHLVRQGLRTIRRYDGDKADAVQVGRHRNGRPCIFLLSPKKLI